MSEATDKMEALAQLISTCANVDADFDRFEKAASNLKVSLAQGASFATLSASVDRMRRARINAQKAFRPSE